MLHFYKDTNPDYLWRIKIGHPFKISRDSKGRICVDLPKWGLVWVNVTDFSKTGKKKKGSKSLIAHIDNWYLDNVIKMYIDNMLYDDYEQMHYYWEWYFRQCKGKFICHQGLV